MIYPFQVLKSEGGLTPKVREAFASAYGKRGLDAFDAVAAMRVKKYRDYFVVVGNHDEYYVDDGVCTCQAALHMRECWHTLAVKIALESGVYEVYDAWYYLGGVDEDEPEYTPDTKN